MIENSQNKSQSLKCIAIGRSLLDIFHVKMFAILIKFT